MLRKRLEHAQELLVKERERGESALRWFMGATGLSVIEAGALAWVILKLVSLHHGR